MSFPGSNTPSAARRRAQRVRLLTALHGICMRIEQTQQSPEAKLACREVAELLTQARLREGVHKNSKKS